MNSSADVSETAGWPSGKVGYVALLGRPNTGKSTLLNTVLDFHLAAVSQKPQTTRRHCLGIYSDKDSQILFLDAPGVHKSAHELDESMNRAILRTLEEADLILCLADPTRRPGQEDQMVAEWAANAGKPVIMAINKIDLADKEQVQTQIDFYGKNLAASGVFEICALQKASINELLNKLKSLLPSGPFFYSADVITDIYERQIGAELIREAVLEQLKEEVPHSVAVTIDSWKQTPGKTAVAAVLHVERESQKGIVIGRNGSQIRAIRQQAQLRLRELCDSEVKLELHVKVDPKWRKKKGKLKEFDLLTS